MPRRHSALLAAIVLLLLVRPLIGDYGMAPIIHSIVILVVPLLSLYAIRVDELVGERHRLVAERRRLSFIGWTLALAATAERLATIFSSSHELLVTGSVVWLLFFAFITWIELRAVLRQRQVTGETISMAISVYLLVGLTWGFLYILIYQLEPHAFSFPSADVFTSRTPIGERVPAAMALVYFSLTTLATISYGDITPLTPRARYAAVAEGLTGQFYLAILIARLVSMQVSGPMSHQAANRPQGSETEHPPKRDS